MSETEILDVFDKKEYVARMEYLLKRERMKPGEFIEKSDYSRATFYRHMDRERPNDIPGTPQLINSARVLRTSIDFLATGRGVEYVSTLELDDYYELIESLYNENKQSYLIILNFLRKREYKLVEVIADTVMFLEQQLDSIKHR